MHIYGHIAGKLRDPTHQVVSSIDAKIFPLIHDDVAINQVARILFRNEAGRILQACVLDSVNIGSEPSTLLHIECWHITSSYSPGCHDKLYSASKWGGNIKNGSRGAWKLTPNPVKPGWKNHGGIFVCL